MFTRPPAGDRTPLEKSLVGQKAEDVVWVAPYRSHALPCPWGEDTFKIHVSHVRPWWLAAETACFSTVAATALWWLVPQQIPKSLSITEDGKLSADHFHLD